MTNIHFETPTSYSTICSAAESFDVVVKDNYIDAVSSTPIDPAVNGY